jgi:hypothetical protein
MVDVKQMIWSFETTMSPDLSGEPGTSPAMTGFDVLIQNDRRSL